MQMSRKAPLEKHLTPQGWLVVQKKGSKILQAWMKRPKEKIQHAKESAAEALYQKAITEKLFVREIPDHWLAIPTGFDLQVHLRFPGQAQKETLEGGLDSALYGGYDGILTMPNTNPYLDDPTILAGAIAQAKLASQNYPVRIAFTASATKGMQGMEAADLKALVKAGASAITDDGWGVKSDEAQEAIFEACAELGVIFQQHAEIGGHKGVAPKSPFQEKEKLPEYPQDAESKMIERDLRLLRKHPKARYHVLHISTRKSLALIKAAKEEGLNVTAEVTPHHLIFSNRDIPSTSDERCTYFKMNPPLFDPEDRAALRAALRDGVVDCVSTDHAPHEKDLKQKGWVLSPFGTRGMETALSALLQLVHEKELTVERLIEVWSTKPREILGFSEFSEASGLLFVNPTAEEEITLEKLPGISENSCFLGSRLHGRWEMRMEAGCAYLKQH